MTRPDDPGDERRNPLDADLATGQVVDDAIEYIGAGPAEADSPAADADAPPPG